MLDDIHYTPNDVMPVVPPEIEDLLIAYLGKCVELQGIMDKGLGSIQISDERQGAENALFWKLDAAFKQGNITEAGLNEIVSTAKELLDDRDKHGHGAGALYLLGKKVESLIAHKGEKPKVQEPALMADKNAQGIVDLLKQGQNPFARVGVYEPFLHLPEELLLAVGGRAGGGVFSTSPSGTIYFRCDFDKKIIFVSPHPDDVGRWIGKEGCRLNSTNRALETIGWKMVLPQKGYYTEEKYKSFSSDPRWTNPDAYTEVVFPKKENARNELTIALVGEKTIHIFDGNHPFLTGVPNKPSANPMHWHGTYEPREDRFYLTSEAHGVEFRGDPMEFCNTFPLVLGYIPSGVKDVLPLSKTIPPSGLHRELAGFGADFLAKKIEADHSKGWLVPDHIETLLEELKKKEQTFLEKK